MNYLVKMIFLSLLSIQVLASDLLKTIEPGMTLQQVILKLGKPDEIEKSYFIGSDTDAIRYGRYWLISTEGQILECVIDRRGFRKNCGMAGCESRSCDWYKKHKSKYILMD